MTDKTEGEGGQLAEGGACGCEEKRRGKGQRRGRGDSGGGEGKTAADEGDKMPSYECGRQRA